MSGATRADCPCARRAAHTGTVAIRTSSSFFISSSSGRGRPTCRRGRTRGSAPTNGISKSEFETELKLPRARAIEPRQVVRRIQLIRADVPLRHRAVVEQVEHAQTDLSPIWTRTEFAADVQLHVLLVLVSRLAVAADRIRRARQRLGAAEADRRRQRILLRRTVGQRDECRSEYRIGSSQLRDDRTDPPARLNDVADAEPEAVRREVLTGHADRIRPVRDARFTPAAAQAVRIAVAEQILRQIENVLER